MAIKPDYGPRQSAKKPFMDARGRWWIYRRDDPLMHTPLGPFFFEDYATGQEKLAYMANPKAPFPASLLHPQPVRPYRTPSYHPTAPVVTVPRDRPVWRNVMGTEYDD